MVLHCLPKCLFTEGLRDCAVRFNHRLAPVFKTIFHQCVISYTCSQSNSDGSVFKTILHQCVISYTCSQSNSDGSVLKQSHQNKTGYKYMA